jgi:hypothetical protein
MKKIISVILLVSFYMYSSNIFSQDSNLGTMLSDKGFVFNEIEQVKNGTGNYYFEGKELKKGNLTYNLSFNFIVKDNGFIVVDNGVFTTSNGYLNFDFSISNDDFSNAEDFFTILKYSESFNFESFGEINFHNLVNLSMFDNKDIIEGILKTETIEEHVIAEKKSGKINIKKMSLKMSDILKIEMNGTLDLNDNKIYNGLLKYKLKDNNYIGIQISKILKIGDMEGSLIINDKTIQEIIF